MPSKQGGTMFLNLMSAVVNNNQAQQGTSIPFLLSGYGSQSIRNLTEEPVPSTLLSSQQQNQSYLHSLGHSINRYGFSRQTLPNVSRQNNNHVSFIDELNSDNTEYLWFSYLGFCKVLVLEKTNVKLYLVVLCKREFQTKVS